MEPLVIKPIGLEDSCGEDLGPPWERKMAGELRKQAITSRVLEGNRLGDPCRRPLWVYLPPSYRREPERRFPVIYLLQAMTNQLDMWTNRSAFLPTALERMDELFAREEVPDTIVVLVDAWTAYGGSQFLDSPGTGRYHTYLCEEVVGAVDAQYRTVASREGRALAGHSSGGYGAMVSAMLRPDLFSALASHAGDALFEVSYQPDFADFVRVMRDQYEGDLENFWKDFRSRPNYTKGSDFTILNVLGMAASYSPDEQGVPVLPFDMETGQITAEVWNRWLTWDPVLMARKHGEALRSMKGIYIEAGKNDEYHLDLGAQAFRKAIKAAGVNEAQIHFELFAGGHGRMEHRYPLAWEYLARILQP